MSNTDNGLRHNYLKRSEAARVAADRDSVSALAKAQLALQPKEPKA